MYTIIKEGIVDVKVPSETKVSKKMPVFYNPVMKLNRDLSVLLIKALAKEKKVEGLKIALPLAGTGVRALRFLSELEDSYIENISVNDYDSCAVALINENIELNKDELQINAKKISIRCDDANVFLLKESCFDYIDIDPFGSPNQFLETSIRRLSKHGVLAVTATDTSALAGTYPKSCRRKYWAEPLRNEMMHELGLRILIRKVQLVAAQFERTLTPVFCYSKEHYIRVFFIAGKGKGKVYETLKQHKYLLYCNKCMSRKLSLFNKQYCVCGEEMVFSGPLYAGDLWDCQLVDTMLGLASEMKESAKLLELIKKECFQSRYDEMSRVGFYDLHKIAKKYNIVIPSFDKLFAAFSEKNLDVSRTHFSLTAVRCSLQPEELVLLMQEKK